MKFVGIDPGLTTGYAEWDTESRTFRSTELAMDVLFRKLERMVWSDQHPTIVVERFTINSNTARKTRQPEALAVIGALEFMRSTGGIYMAQSPTSRKPFGTNAKLKALGWFHGGAGHADDAARHMLAYLVTRPEGALILERLAA